MKKGIKILCCFLVLAIVFLIGWRVMPQIWPGIKKAVVYPVFPQLEPTPAPTAEPYHPQSDSSIGDPINKTDSLIYYFYKDYCHWCRMLEPLTAGLPKEIFLEDGTKSTVKLICLNKVEEDKLQIITEYYETHEIPEEERYVPAMVIGDQYLFGNESIVQGLLNALTAGEGLKTGLLDGTERQ